MIQGLAASSSLQETQELHPPIYIITSIVKKMFQLLQYVHRAHPQTHCLPDVAEKLVRAYVCMYLLASSSWLKCFTNSRVWTIAESSLGPSKLRYYFSKSTTMIIECGQGLYCELTYLVFGLKCWGGCQHRAAEPQYPVSSTDSKLCQ